MKKENQIIILDHSIVHEIILSEVRERGFSIIKVEDIKIEEDTFNFKNLIIEPIESIDIEEDIIIKKHPFETFFKNKRKKF